MEGSVQDDAEGVWHREQGHESRAKPFSLNLVWNLQSLCLCQDSHDKYVLRMCIEKSFEGYDGRRQFRNNESFDVSGMYRKGYRVCEFRSDS